MLFVYGIYELDMHVNYMYNIRIYNVVYSPFIYFPSNAFESNFVETKT